MRLLAFALLALAAFDVGVPWLDRPGAAALGLACYVLARAPGGILRPHPALNPYAALLPPPMPEPEPVTRDLRERVGAYAEEGR